MDVQTARCNNTSDPLCYEEGSDQLAVIIIPALLALSTVGVVVLLMCNLFLKRHSGRRATSLPSRYVNGQESVSISGSEARPPPGIQDALTPWQIPGDYSVEGLEFWQAGRYGPICRGSLKREATSTPVVVKRLRDGSNQCEAREFMDWVLFHATVCKHDNLVRMLFCQTRRLPMYLVLETSSPGNLLHFLWMLRNTDSSEDPLQHFSEKSVFLASKQVAVGLDYLLSEHRLVHGDVAARNILIGPGLSVKVSGLGVAFAGRQKDTVAKRRALEVPLKWQAPERIMRQPVTDRSDVWSFGILLYEMITLGSPPYPELEPLSVFPQLQKSYRMKRPEACGVPLYDLMKYCWMWNFKDRPAFSAIMKLLESYTYLAGTKALHSTDGMDIVEYRGKAGIIP